VPGNQVKNWPQYEALRRQGHLDQACTAVLADVGQCLFDDAVEVESRLGPDARGPGWGDRQQNIDVSPFLEPSQQGPNGLRKPLLDSGLTPQVVKHVPQVGEHISGGLLQLTKLSEHALPSGLFDLEVFELDQHRGECLGDTIVELASQHAPDLV